MGRSTKRGIVGAVLSATGLAGPVAGIVGICRRRCCDPVVAAWPDEPAWGDDGLMTTVEGFRSFVESARPCWRHDPIGSSLAILGIDPGADAPIDTVTVDRAPSAGSGEVDVTLTYDIEGDDAVAG